MLKKAQSKFSHKVDDFYNSLVRYLNKKQTNSKNKTPHSSKPDSSVVDSVVDGVNTSVFLLLFSSSFFFQDRPMLSHINGKLSPKPSK